MITTPHGNSIFEIQPSHTACAGYTLFKYCRIIFYFFKISRRDGKSGKEIKKFFINEVLIKLRNLDLKKGEDIMTVRKFYSGNIAVQMTTVKIKKLIKK